MKLDIKSILILVLLGFSLIFFYMWYFRGSDNYKDELKKLKEENKILNETRDSITSHLNTLNVNFNLLKKEDSLLRIKIYNQDLEIQKFKNKANASKEKLNKLLKELEDTRNKIQELKNNPPNRTGEDLLNSIKIKTTK
jgi:chromosome segregation ATPase